MLLRLGGAVVFTLDSEDVFSGELVALESQVAPEAMPSVVLRLRGTRRLATPKPRGISTTLRVGAEVQQASDLLEGSPAKLHFVAEENGALAAAPDALRVGDLVGLQGLGTSVDGRFRLQEVALRFETTRGLTWPCSDGADKGAPPAQHSSDSGFGQPHRHRLDSGRHCQPDSEGWGAVTEADYPQVACAVPTDGLRSRSPGPRMFQTGGQHLFAELKSSR